MVIYPRGIDGIDYCKVKYIKSKTLNQKSEIVSDVKKMKEYFDKRFHELQN